MRSSPVSRLIDAVERASFATVDKPWGRMHETTVPIGEDGPWEDLLLKEITVNDGHRTSLQLHVEKDEIIIILDGTGFVDVGDERFSGVGAIARIKPNVAHRVTGPLRYIELSDNYPNDVVRLADDYGRES